MAPGVDRAGGASLPGVRGACSLASLDHLQEDLFPYREWHEHADPLELIGIFGPELMHAWLADLRQWSPTDPD